jgi:CelD/BcsL family acetyltransferase involved in cellulose biosynthesis
MEKSLLFGQIGFGRLQHSRQTTDEFHDGDKVTIAYFDNAIPPFVEHEMERLYENLFSSVAMVRAYGGTAGVSTYVARRGGKPVAIFLLRRERARIVVLNEQISVDVEEVERLARYVFARFKSIGTICFGAIDVRAHRFPFPFQRAHFTNDIVLALPDGAPKYLASLGKSTRQNIKHYLGRIQRDFPTFRHSVFENGAEGEHIFGDIIRLNRARMSEKDKICGVDDDEARRLLALAQQHGLVSVLTIDGQVCAGAICYRIGANFFLRVIAHDSQFNAYGLGLLCCYLAICECIARGGREFHFMWGREEYKYRLLGQQRDFDSLALYRSRPHMLLDCRRVLKTALSAYRERVKSWLLDPKNQTRAPARQVKAALALLRRIRRARHHERQEP